ncbi:MAG: adenylate/guanylate cyclase domain-containing protein [Azospirillaceae bacterium]
MTEPRRQRRLAAILAADMVGYSALMHADEDRAARVVGDLRAGVIEPVVAANGGRVFKVMGDGFLAEFPSVVDALEAALALQERLGPGGENEAGASPAPALRVAIHVGDVLVEADDLLGDGVNLATRLEALAEPGTVLVSEDVVRQAEGRAPVAFRALGPRRVKGRDRAVPVFRADRRGSGDGTGASAPTTPDAAEASIAVLPFANLSGDPDQAYFADGLAEDLITDLSRLPRLAVIARNSSFAFKDRSVDVRDVGAALGVGHLLEGSVRRSGNRVRVSAQLVDAATGAHVWAERYDRDLADIFEMQDEITREIVGALALTLTRREEARIGARYAEDARAHDLYLRARAVFQSFSRSSNAEARALADAAIDADPGLAPAYALRAFIRFLDWVFNWGETDTAGLRAAIADAEQAVMADPAFPGGHARLAWTLLWDRRHDEAIRAGRTALALDPNNAEAMVWLAEVHNFAGEPEAALPLMEAAARLDPLSPTNHPINLGHGQFMMGRVDEAIATFAKVAARAPDFPIAHLYLAMALGEAGEAERAAAAMGHVRRLWPGISLSAVAERFPYRRRADLDRMIAGLGAAGLDG